MRFSDLVELALILSLALVAVWLDHVAFTWVGWPF